MKHIDVVFDGPPSHVSGRFVEVEDDTGASVSVGEWVERPDGYWALRFPAPPEAAATGPARSTTNRGFVVYDQFTDLYGADVYVRESSLATADAVWLFTKGGTDGNDGAAHLDLDGARRVRDALDAFIRDHDA